MNKNLSNKDIVFCEKLFAKYNNDSENLRFYDHSLNL